MTDLKRMMITHYQYMYYFIITEENQCTCENPRSDRVVLNNLHETQVNSWVNLINYTQEFRLNKPELSSN